MKTTVPATSTSGAAPPVPGSAIGVGNVINAAKLAEKTIELTTCAQFGHLFGTRMVWFGLTQKQERQHGFDAATNLGGQAFILQFKVSSTVLSSGTYSGCRRFSCQHQQMQQLRNAFGGTQGCCFYFLPDVGTFNELSGVGGDTLGNSFLVDVADLPAIIPATHRKNGYHYAYLDSSIPELTITSQPFKPKTIVRASDFSMHARKQAGTGMTSTARIVDLARALSRANTRLADLLFKNAALAVIP